MAVVGISKRNPLSPGRIVLLKNEFEMNVEVFGIYPTGGDIEGIQLYERLDKLPKIPDLLVIREKVRPGKMRSEHPQGPVLQIIYLPLGILVEDKVL